jgi:cell division protein FtsI (penicillin-binding protein 3)
MPAFRSPVRAGGGFRPRVRLIFLLVGMSLCFLGIAGRLVWVQGVDSSHFVALASVQRDRTITLPASRGQILDRNGNVLAMSVDAKTIIADPRQISDPSSEATQLAPMLGVTATVLAKTLSNGSGFAYLAHQIDPATATSILALGLPGITDVDDPKRVYPDGQLAAQVIGFVGADGQGLGGLESSHNTILTGKAGQEDIQADPAGQEIVSAASQLTPPVQGADLQLTLDQDIQFESESALAQAVQSYHAEGGSIVVLQPSTGNILALANYPSFDPNNFATATAEDMTDRALSDVYEPGSTNKVITASAALESGVVTTQTVITVPDTLKVAGSTFHDAETHATLNLTLPQILEQSSNVGTIKIALQVGAPTLDKYLLKFGYGQPTGIGLPGESGGLLPTLPNWSGTTLPTAAIGQGVAITVLQMASVYATIANGGIYMRPRIVAGQSNATGQIVPSAPTPTHRVIQASTARTITSMLLQVINGSTGTGAEAAIPGYQVAGKTGTAQKPANGGYAGYVASFMGFAPAQDPQLVVGVVLDQPTPIWGADTAAPTFKTVMQFALQRLGIGPGPVLPASNGTGGTPLPAPARSGDAPAYPLPGPSSLPVAPGATD